MSASATPAGPPRSHQDEASSPLLTAWSAFLWLWQLSRGTAPGSAEADAAFDVWIIEVEARPALIEPARLMLQQWLQSTRAVSLFADLGLLTADGLDAEWRRRLFYKLLPEDIDPAQLRDWLRCLFRRPDIARWWSALDDARWLRLLQVLGVLELPAAGREHLAIEWQEALLVLSARVAATGVDAQVARVYPDSRRSASPFLEQQVAVRAFIDAFRQDSRRQVEDAAHAQVLLHQCLDVVMQIRRNARRTGISVRLAYRLQRLEDTVLRLTELMGLVDLGDAPGVVQENSMQFLRETIRRCADQSSLRTVLRKGTDLAARQAVMHAGRTGEHYAAATRRQWFAILRGAAIGGLVIAPMALFKIQILKWHLPPLVEGSLVCLNYGLGFVLIHMLGGIVATKQPAMTAARFATTLGEASQKGVRATQTRLRELSLQVVRGQWIAVLGNVMVALPVAALITWLMLSVLHQPIADPHKAGQLLAQLDPFAGTFMFAAIAGVCLFLAGVISGYCDNLCVFHHLPRRLANMPLLVRTLGWSRALRIGVYTEHNFGALVGNFAFGLLLGGASLFGQLSGLPVDIRHVAFASANLAVAGVSLWEVLPWSALIWALLGVMGIGLVNLLVSFSLSLWVALRAQRLPRSLLLNALGEIFRHLRSHPLDPWRLPPASDDSQGKAGRLK